MHFSEGLALAGAGGREIGSRGARGQITDVTGPVGPATSPNEDVNKRSKSSLKKRAD